MNRFVQFEYNDKPLPPMNNNNNGEILSLDTALKPVLHNFDQLDHYIHKAKQLSQIPSESGLTEDESAALYLYTDNCEGQSVRDVLNGALQSEDRTLLEPWYDYLKLFYNALAKLPSVKDIIWRSLPSNIAERLQVNDELVCCRITPCLTSHDVVNSFLDQNSVLCSIKPLTGKDIHEYSTISGYHEVLLLPGTRLRVKSKQSNNGMNMLTLCFEEMSDVSEESPSPMDVTMASPFESADKTDTADDDQAKVESTTSIDMLNNESPSDNEKSKNDEPEVTIAFVNGDRYLLSYIDGNKQDYGEYDSIDRDNFQGQTAANKANGEGIGVFKNGDYFIGTFERGVRNGRGILYKADGSTEAGTWVNDEPTDQFSKLTSSGNTYEWTDKSDAQRWYGVYYDKHGNRYIGNVKGGRAHGLGVRFWADGSRYEGYFENDKKHGFGTYHFTDLDIYAGQWDNDEIDGDGEFSWSSGTNYQGHFTNGKRHGEGKVIFANRKVQEGQWKNDEYIK